MGKKMSVAFLLLVVMAVYWIPYQSESLKCFICNSMHNKSCDKLQGDEYLMDCSHMSDKPQNYTNCRIETFSVSSKEFNMETSRVVRSCGIERHYRQSCYYSSNIDLKSSTCECEEDGCNAAYRLSFSETFLLSACLAAILAQQIT